jgi:hypothetical protein
VLLCELLTGTTPVDKKSLGRQLQRRDPVPDQNHLLDLQADPAVFRDSILIDTSRGAAPPGASLGCGLP